MQSFEAVGGITVVGRCEVRFADGVETFAQAFVSDGLPRMLALYPSRGRWFRDDESRMGLPVAVVVSERFWHERLGSSADAVGAILRIPWGARVAAVTVVGVLPASPILPLVFQQDPDLFFPASNLSEWYQRSSSVYEALVQLRPGVSFHQAQTELQATIGEMRRDYPAENRGLNPRILPLKSVILGKAEGVLWLLFLAAGAVWLISAANFGALLAARLDERRVDFAIRCALGAARRHLFREIAREVSVVAGISAAVGVSAGWAGLRFIRMHSGWFGIPRLADVRIDAAALTFSISAALGAGVLGLLGSRGHFVESHPGRLLLNGTEQRLSRAGRFVDALVAAQFCLALLVVNTAALAGHSLVRAETRVLGYDARDVLAMQVRIPLALGLNEADRERILQSIIDFAASLPGVKAATGAYPRPTTKDFLREFVPMDGATASSPDRSRAILAVQRNVASNYFRAMAIPVVRGQLFPQSERAASDEILVNEAFGRAYFRDQEVLGRRLYSTLLGPKKPLHVIGVVGDSIENPLDSVAQPTVYLRQLPNWLDILIRTDNPLTAIRAVRAFVHSVNPAIPLDRIETLDNAIQAPLAQSKTQTFLAGVFAVVSALLAAAGLYGIVGRASETRRREYAIRLALGATGHQLLRMRLLGSLGAAAVGLISGLLISVACGRIIQAMLFQVPASDFPTLACATCFLLLVALVAAYSSVRGKVGLEPSELFRSL